MIVLKSMKKIEFENYSQIFDEYISIFKNHEGINDICWSGTVSDPGISDLDIILIIDSWRDFKPSLRMLNPERISKIFYHGPIICNKKYIKEFFSFTNLNIFKNFYKKKYRHF